MKHRTWIWLALAVLGIWTASYVLGYCLGHVEPRIVHYVIRSL